MPLSRDPEKRAKQLANLNRGGNPAPGGNAFRKTHGGYATVVAERVEAKVAEVFNVLEADAPLPHPANAVVLHLLAEALCRLDDVSANLRDHGLFDAKTKEPRRAIDVEAALRKEAAGYADDLGLTPRSRARLGLDVARTAISVAQALSEEDPQIRRALLREAGIDVDAEEEA